MSECLYVSDSDMSAKDDKENSPPHSEEVSINTSMKTISMDRNNKPCYEGIIDINKKCVLNFRKNQQKNNKISCVKKGKIMKKGKIIKHNMGPGNNRYVNFKCNYNGTRANHQIQAPFKPTPINTQQANHQIRASSNPLPINTLFIGDSWVHEFRKYTTGSMCLELKGPRDQILDFLMIPSITTVVICLGTTENGIETGIKFLLKQPITYNRKIIVICQPGIISRVNLPPIVVIEAINAQHALGRLSLILGEGMRMDPMFPMSLDFRLALMTGQPIPGAMS